MNLRKLSLGVLSAAILATPMVGKAVAADQVYLPLLVYRTGPYAPSGIPLANGFVDYFKLVNAQGGVNGAKIVWEECETQYDTKQGVECYERLKGQHGGALIFNPYSTGITYQLIPKASGDKVVIHSMGYGRTDAADGTVFPWVFNFPTTYWSQASAVVRYIGQQEGGMDKLKGKKIAHIFHNSPYGKEANPTLEKLAEKYGFKLNLLAVDHPGQEQGATWLQVRRLKPDWIFMSGWGVMNSVAIKEAAAIKYPMDHFIGNWWSGSEADVRPAGGGAKGYKSATFHGAGTDFKVHQDIIKTVYKGDKEAAKAAHVGEVLYNRGLVNAAFNVQAIRIAQEKFKTKSPNGEQVRWAFENFELTEARLKELGMTGFTHPVEITCKDHEGNGPVRIQQWGGTGWKYVSDWIEPMDEVVRPMIEASASAYAKQNKIEVRDCKKAS